MKAKRAFSVFSVLNSGAVLLAALLINLPAFAQDPPVYQIVNTTDPVWVHTGSSFIMNPISEDPPNEIWERSVEDNKWSDDTDTDTKTATGKYYAYADLEGGAWGVGNVDGVDWLFVKWDVVGGYYQEPGGSPQPPEVDEYIGHYYWYAEFPGQEAILIEVEDAKSFGTSYVDNGKIKIWYEGGEGNVPEWPSGFQGSEVAGEARRNGSVIEVAVPISAINFHTLSDFDNEPDWAHIGAAVSNPSSPSDMWAYYSKGPGIGDGIEYDTLLFDNANPSIDIEKSTNGSDSDAAPGNLILAGTSITWSYVVANTGNTVLTDIAVTDDQLGAVTCPFTTLAAGDDMTCNVMGTAVAGQYSNLGTVVGSSPGNTDDVTDNDPSNYFGADPSIDIEKATNGFDADTAPGPNIAVGAAITWTYVVTNNGNVELTSVGVTDDMLGAITCDWPGSSDAGTPAGTLSPTETVTCMDTGLAALDDYANVGTASGTLVGGPTVTDNDPSHYFGTAPSIQITKTASPQTYSAAGTTITYALDVTNNGNVTLTGVTITDQTLTGLSAVICTEAHPIADMAPGETVNCSATYDITAPDVTAGLVTNIAAVEGQCTVANCPVTDTDDETVTSAAEASITITKTASPNTYTAVGDQITYTFLVTNNGDATLFDVAVTDETPLPGLSAIDCGAPDNDNLIPVMAPGESVSCTATYSIGDPDILDPYYVDNTAQAVGYPCPIIPDEGRDCDPVSDTDDETINAILINLVKTVTSGPIYDPATGRYTVVYNISATNIGTAPGVYDVVDDEFINLAAGINPFGTPVVTYVPGDDSLDVANDPPGWPNIALAENIGAGKTEAWNVTAEFTLTPGDLDAAARDCEEDDAEAGTGFYNSVATFTGETNTDDNDDCVDLPDPDLDLSKVVETTENIGLDKFRVTYLVQVDNTGDGPGLYDISDVPGFGSGIALDGTPTVTYVAIDDLFTPTPVTAPAWTQIALNETISGQSSESWRVVAEFDIDLLAAGYVDDRECVISEGGWVSGKGFFNSVELAGFDESNTLNNKDCSDPDDPLINLSKTAAPAVYQGSGLFDVTYTFTADNQSTVFASYDLVDTLLQGAALAPLAIQVPTAYVAGTENDQDGTIESPVIGDFVTGATLVTGETLAAGANESWTITIRFQLTPALATAENANCVDDTDEAGYTGFNNRILGALSETDFTDNEACVDLKSGRIELALQLIPPLADTFQFEGATSTALLGNGGLWGLDVYPGTYVGTLPRTRLVFPDWTWIVLGFTCDDGDSVVDLNDGTDLIATYEVNPEETVRCTLVLMLPQDIAVPVNNPLALLLMTLMMLAAGWYFRPAVMRK